MLKPKLSLNQLPFQSPTLKLISETLLALVTSYIPKYLRLQSCPDFRGARAVTWNETLQKQSF